MATKISFSRSLTRSGHAPITVLLWVRLSTRQGRLATAALLGRGTGVLRPRICRQAPKSVSARRRDDLVIANGKVTSKATYHACPQCFLRPAEAPVGSRNHRVSRGALSASSRLSSFDNLESTTMRQPKAAPGQITRRWTADGTLAKLQCRHRNRPVVYRTVPIRKGSANRHMKRGGDF